jgi:hypothetical protein
VGTALRFFENALSAIRARETEIVVVIGGIKLVRFLAHVGFVVPLVIDRSPASHNTNSAHARMD